MLQGCAIILKNILVISGNEQACTPTRSL